MSKTITKVIAALGVVAGIGVAALPLSSYAANDIVIDVEVQVSGPVVPDCTSANCSVPGTNNPNGQTITIKDGDTALNLCQSRLSGGETAGAACANNNGTNATGTTAIPTLATAATTVPHGPSATPLGWGIKFNAMSGYTPSGTITTMFQPSNATSIGTFASSGITADATLTFEVNASYANNTEAGFYTDVLTVTASGN